MSGSNLILLDTNIIVLGLEGNLTIRRFLKKYILHISIITEIELLSIPFEDQADEKEEAARIRKKWNVKLPDAIISATAISNKMNFYSADRGFNKIQEPSFRISYYS
jgi:predicted nucleic acid-binding protein